MSYNDGDNSDWGLNRNICVGQCSAPVSLAIKLEAAEKSPGQDQAALPDLF